MLKFKEYLLLEDFYTKHPGTQYGSNEGGLYTHTPSMRKLYVKFPQNEEQMHVEAATAELYNHLGIKTLDPKVQDVSGRKALTTQWNDNAAPMRTASALHREMETPEKAHQLALMHHAAIMTGNLDIVGLEYDNILKDRSTGDLISADQGGAMHYRAQGAHKDFTSNIDREISGFQNPAYASGKVFSKLPHQTLIDASHKLKSLSDETIDSVMKKHNLDHLSNTVKARRDALINHYA